MSAPRLVKVVVGQLLGRRIPGLWVQDSGLVCRGDSTASRFQKEKHLENQLNSA